MIKETVMALTPAQQAHVDGVFPEHRAQMADYLESGVGVVILAIRIRVWEPSHDEKSKTGLPCVIGRPISFNS